MEFGRELDRGGNGEPRAYPRVYNFTSYPYLMEKRSPWQGAEQMTAAPGLYRSEGCLVKQVYLSRFSIGGNPPSAGISKYHARSKRAIAGRTMSVWKKIRGYQGAIKKEVKEGGNSYGK